jgi:hypothetical protein
MGPAILCDACPRPDRYEGRASSGKPNKIRPLASPSATFVPVWLRRVVGQSLVKTFPLRLGDPIAIPGEHYPAPHEWFRLAALTALSRAIEHVRVTRRCAGRSGGRRAPGGQAACAGCPLRALPRPSKPRETRPNESLDLRPVVGEKIFVGLSSRPVLRVRAILMHKRGFQLCGCWRRSCKCKTRKSPAPWVTGMPHVLRGHRYMCWLTGRCRALTNIVEN